MSKPLIVLAPDHLVAAVSAALKRVPAMRGVDTKRAVILRASDNSARVQPDIVIAPTLKSILDWSYHRHLHWPSTYDTATRQLVRLSESATRGSVSIVEERDLKARPSRLWQAVANAAQPSRWVGGTIGARVIGRHTRSHAGSYETCFLHMYSDLPVRRGASAWCPFFRFDTHSGPCLAPIDITGRARALCFGPYLVLPRGVWRAELKFELSDEASAYDYLVRFGTIGEFVDLPYRPKAAGMQTVTLCYDVREHKPLELRIYLRRAAFHGTLKLEGAMLTKVSELHDKGVIASKRDRIRSS